jgi:prophage regulatory protein
MPQKHTPQALPRLIRFKEVIQRTGRSRAAIYQAMEHSDFPKTVKLGPKSVAFVESEIDDWIASRIAKRDTAQTQAA